MSSPTQTISAPEELWTARDVAKWSKTSQSVIYKWAGAGVLPSIKIGSLLRFNPNDVKAFFLSGGDAKRKVVPTKNNSR